LEVDLNWTPQQAKAYIQRRLAQEQRAREKMQAHAKNHNPVEIPAAVAEPHPRPALVAPAYGEAPGLTCPLQRATITYVVRAQRPCDYDNWCIKFLQDCLIAAGILDDDNWQVLQGTVVSEKCANAEEEGVTVIIETP